MQRFSLCDEWLNYDLYRAKILLYLEPLFGTVQDIDKKIRT